MKIKKIKSQGEFCYPATIAAAVKDANFTKSTDSGDVPMTQGEINQYLNQLSSDLATTIEDNEKVTATALNTLNTDYSDLKDKMIPATSSDLGLVKIGDGLSVDENGVISSNSTAINFAVKNTLTNCTFSNDTASVAYNESYSNVVTLEDTYEIKSLTITMGGIDITDTAWSNNTITIEHVTGNIYINGLVTNGYVITQNLPNASSTNTPVTVQEGEAFTTTITPNEGYNLTGVTVTMGGSDITTTSYSNGVVTIASVTAEVVITAATAQITFDVTFVSEGVNSVWTNVNDSGKIGYGDTLITDINLKSNYIIRESLIEVKENGVARSFTWKDTTLSIANVKGDIYIDCHAVATHTITYTLNNVVSSNSDSTVASIDTFTTTLSYDTDAFNALDVTVTMGGKDITESAYDPKTLVISIVKPTGDLIISAEAITTIYKDYETKIDLTGQTWQFNKLRDVSTETFDTSLMAASYDDSSWETVSIPHDFSIYNSFNTSTSGNEYESGWLSGGDVVYRTKVTIPESYKGNKVYIHFDGVYMTSEVYINGTSVGTNKNGYIPFDFDITDQVTYGAENTIAVAVSHRIPNSRWYSGGGIYRECWISMINVAELGTENIVITTPNLATEQNGTVTTNIAFTVENATASDITVSEVTATVYQEWDGTQVGTQTLTSQSLKANSSNEFTIEVGVNKPTLWTTHDLSDTIRLYKATVAIKYTANDKEYLVTSTPELFGYRYITYDADGFYLNGTKTFLKGMCFHHDNGMLGAETYHDASERQLRIIGDAGCNTIRTTHNPQSKVFLECAARQGFMVIEELFDGWRYSKNSNTYDYARFFSQSNDYIEVVVKNTIKRDRNNPAIIMWSIGNEVQEGCSASFSSTYVNDATTINNYVKQYDTTRPTTSGNNQPANTYGMQIMALVDIAGVNYGDDSEYSTLRNASSNGVSFSTKCIYGSETTSPFYTRGIYETASSSNYYTSFDLSNSESSNSHASWGDSSCVALKRHAETYTWLAGLMPWTGFDYIGEPTPSNSTSVRSSFFGIVDLCGIPKDAYYMYQAKWTTTPMVRIVPEDWTTWTEGSATTVWVYSNCNSVKLHLNGTEVTSTATPSTGSHYAYEYSVTYAKGTLVATGYDSSNNIVAQDIRYSAANASKIGLYTDKTQVAKDGLLYVECHIEDKYSCLVPRATNKVTFTCVGGEVLGTDNGFEGCMEDMRNAEQSCFTGKCVAVIKPTADSVVVTATTPGLADGTLTIPVGDNNIYAASETTEFVDPTDPPVNSSVTSITVDNDNVHFDNGSSVTITVTKTPSGAKDAVTIQSVPTGFSATVDGNEITVTNTADDVKGLLAIECGGLIQYVNVSCGSAVVATCTMLLNGEESDAIYVNEYMPVTFTPSDGTVDSVVLSAGANSLNYENGILYGKAEGTATLTVTLSGGDVFNFSITVSSWVNSSSTLSTAGINSNSSKYYLPTITSYTTSTSLSGQIMVQVDDSTATSYIAVLDVPTSATISSTTLAEFGTDATGQRKAYVVSFTGTAGGDLYYTLSMKDTENGLHKINVRTLANKTKSWSYKIGTLSCTSLEVSPTTINITSDEENQQVITYKVLPAETTDDLTFTSANSYVTVTNGHVHAIKNGTDTITVTCGDQSATVTVNISNVTEDETILAYEASATGEAIYYAGGSTGIDWDSTYTLYAELKVSADTSKTANLISFGSDISSWSGTHYHIYYPSTTNSTSVGNFSNTTTSGICIAMGTSGLTTCGVTTTMKGGQELDTVYLVQNANGLWINGTEATSITTSSGSFATIQKLTTVQIGSQEGSTHFSGTIKQLRRIKTTDLATAYQTTGLTSTELEDISNNGLDLAKYLAAYESTTASETVSKAIDEAEAFAVTSEYLEGLQEGSEIPVVLVNPHKSNGYIFGYNTTTVGYSNYAINQAVGFTNVDAMSEQVSRVLNSQYASYFLFTLTKTADGYILKLDNGYSPVGETGTLSWSTTPIEFTISNEAGTTTSLTQHYSEDNLIRFKNPSGYYLSAQGSPSAAKFTSNLSEWTAWYVYKMNV